MRSTRPIRILCALLLYSVVAAIVLNLFMARWGFHDHNPRYGFEQIIAYSADRPFVYRVLVPVIANGLARITPQSVEERVDAAANAARSVVETGTPRSGPESEWLQSGFESIYGHFGWADGFALERLYVYLILFACLVCLQVTLRRLGSTFFDAPDHVQDAAPAIAVLLLPITFQMGGFLYDFPDLLLTTLTVLLLLRARWLAYYFVFVLAVLNKETAVLLVLAPWVIHRHVLPRTRLLLHSALHVALAAPTILLVRHLLRDNPGADFEWHVYSNVRYFLDPRSYLVFDDVYGPLLMFPVFFNLVLVALAAFFVLHRWREKPRSMRELLIAYLVVLTPLFLAAGWYNEVRVFYLMAPASYVLALHTVLSMYGLQTSAPPPRASGQRN